MAKSYATVREHLGRAANKNKHYRDHEVRRIEYQPGDKVWCYSPRCGKGRSPKWNHCYSGPYEIVRKVNAVNYVIRKSPRAKCKVVHVNKLMPYQPVDF